MEIAVILVVVLLVGLAIGTAAGWFFRSREVTQAYEQAMQAGRQRDAALGELRDETSRRATFEALAAGIPEMNREIEARSMSIAQLQRTMLDVSREKEALGALVRGFAEPGPRRRQRKGTVTGPGTRR